MAFKCKIGIHSWNFCICSDCKKNRNEQHDWSKDCEKCSQCGKTTENQHNWTKDCEKCSKCGKTRNDQHDWRLNCAKCSICGFVRMNQHDFIEGKCSKCGKVKPIIEWVSIPSGTFTMGSPTSEVGRRPDEIQHKVTISAFKMSKYEVTFEQYDLFCEATCRVKPNDEGWGRGKRPVINVDWNDAIAFANWMGCFLPTEAQWEYACRAMKTTPFNTGSNLTTVQGNYNGSHPYNNHAKGEYRGKTMPVGSYDPNDWGLYDMHGNICEWCIDWYGDYYTWDETDPTGKVNGMYRVLRGGYYVGDAQDLRSAYRGYDKPDSRCDSIGFRVVDVDIVNDKQIQETIIPKSKEIVNDADSDLKSGKQAKDIADVHYDNGCKNASLGYPSKAIQDYDKAIEIYPKDPDYFFNRALAKMKVTDFKGAISDFSEVIKLNSNDYEAYFNRGITYGDLKNHQKAINDYTACLRINPSYSDAYLNRGAQKVQLKKYEDAITDYNEAIRLDPVNGKFYASRAVAKAILKDRFGALEDAQKAEKYGMYGYIDIINTALNKYSEFDGV